MRPLQIVPKRLNSVVGRFDSVCWDVEGADKELERSGSGV